MMESIFIHQMFPNQCSNKKFVLNYIQNTNRSASQTEKNLEQTIGLFSVHLRCGNACLQQTILEEGSLRTERRKCLPLGSVCTCEILEESVLVSDSGDTQNGSQIPSSFHQLMLLSRQKGRAGSTLVISARLLWFNWLLVSAWSDHISRKCWKLK